MRRIVPWLLAVLVLVAGFFALAALGLVAFWQGPVAAFFAALAGVSVLWVLLDNPTTRRRSSP